MTEPQDGVLIPIVGAAGGALAIALASERLGVDRTRVALTGADVAAAVAGSTTGWARQLASGAAAAGVVIALVDHFRERDVMRAAAAPAEPADVAPSAATASDALTPEELAHLEAIAARLDPIEREQLDEVERRGAPEVIRRLKRALVAMSVDDAVAYLRRNALPKPRPGQARNKAYAPAVRA
jgi:hypothetical protein